MNFDVMIIFGAVVFVSLGLGFWFAGGSKKGSLIKRSKTALGFGFLISPVVLVLAILCMYLYLYQTIVQPLFFGLVLLLSLGAFWYMAHGNRDGLGTSFAMMTAGPFILISLVGIGISVAQYYFTVPYGQVIAVIPFVVLIMMPVGFVIFANYKKHVNA